MAAFLCGGYRRRGTGINRSKPFPTRFDYLYENLQNMKRPKFILNRTDDYLHHSKKWMIGHALLFYVASIFCFVALQMVCSYIYGLFGVSPESLTKFGGDPQYQIQKKSTLEFLLSVLLVAPLCEEVIFRFGISLKRNAVALWVAIAPAILTWYLISKNCIIVGVALLIGLLIGAYIFFGTDDSLWDKVRAKMSLAVVWISALAFGLLHLNAFTDMSWVILPYALCICVWPFLGGCAITYLRMNMGFFAGLIMHIVVNLPGVIGSLFMSM